MFCPYKVLTVQYTRNIEDSMNNFLDECVTNINSFNNTRTTASRSSYSYRSNMSVFSKRQRRKGPHCSFLRNTPFLSWKERKKIGYFQQLLASILDMSERVFKIFSK